MYQAPPPLPDDPDPFNLPPGWVMVGALVLMVGMAWGASLFGSYELNFSIGALIILPIVLGWMAWQRRTRRW
jgi:hypothetical protein